MVWRRRKDASPRTAHLSLSLSASAKQLWALLGDGGASQLAAALLAFHYSITAVLQFLSISVSTTSSTIVK